MEWTPDASAGDWLRDLIDADENAAFGATMHSVVPRGFPAYARVLHPPQVSWVVGRPYPSQDELRETDPARWPVMQHADTTWAETAAVFGTRVHGLAQWNAVVRTGTDHQDWHQVIGPDGREYSSPAEGSIRPDLLRAVAEHLVAHTTTPDAGHVAVWSGWGGLVGTYGEGSSRAVLIPSDASGPAPDPRADPDAANFDRQLQERHREMLGRSTSDPFNNVFRKPAWQPGVLSDEISHGPRLELPAREHVLFRGGVRELTDPEWIGRVPWSNTAMPEFTESPSLAWPDDRAWVLVTEVDYDSTVIAGSVELVQALVEDARLEAFAIPEDADLGWDADEVNR